MRAILCVLVVTACGAPARVDEPASPARTCTPELPGVADLVAPGATLFLGELHGTTEMPAFLGDVACAASLQGPTTVGLEIPDSEQARIDRFLDDGDRAALLEGDFWSVRDGRSSVAMLELLDRLRRERLAGADITVLAFDLGPAAGPLGASRDRRMAENVIAARRAAPDRTFVLYAGNVHSRTRTGVPWDPTFEPMGWFIVEAGIPVLSLDVRLDGGGAWVCILDDAGEMRCGEHETAPTATGVVRAIELGATETGHDGFYVVGPTTASPPAAQ